MQKMIFNMEMETIGDKKMWTRGQRDSTTAKALVYFFYFKHCGSQSCLWCLCYRHSIFQPQSHNQCPSLHHSQFPKHPLAGTNNLFYTACYNSATIGSIKNTSRVREIVQWVGCLSCMGLGQVWIFPRVPLGVIPESKVSNNPWASSDVGQIKTKRKKNRKEKCSVKDNLWKLFILHPRLSPYLKVH